MKYYKKYGEDVEQVLLLLVMVLIVEVLANAIFTVMFAIRMGSFDGAGRYILEIISWPVLAESIPQSGPETIAAIIGSYLLAVGLVGAVVRVSR